MFSVPCNLGTGCRVEEPDGGQVQDIGICQKPMGNTQQGIC